MADRLKVGELFAGIGAWGLGLERTGGFQVAWACDAEPFCRKVLAHHWPGLPIYPDIRDLRGADVEPVDVLTGGFPCQDLSYAGRGAGLKGERSGLWSEYARLIRELRPRWVLVENVPALAARGLGTVLGDLAALGYDAEWDCIPASALGAPHRRDRIWIVAYPAGEHGGSGRAGRPPASGQGQPVAVGPFQDVADADGMARPSGGALEGGRPPVLGPGALERTLGRCRRLGDTWQAEPDVGRVADGVPARVDRLRALGNASLPQISEWIGRRILEWERAG